jgi:hypothetical protein
MTPETRNEITADTAEPTSLYCSAEWHLARLKDRYAILIFNLALRLSRGNENQFSASIPTLATYFGVAYKTIWRAIHSLRAEGFFIVLKEEPGKPVVYHVLTHREWVERKGDGNCAKKLVYAWTGEESDRLGVELFAASNQRVRVFPNQLKALRATKLLDKYIVFAWRRFLETDKPTGERWKGAIYRFLKSLKSPKALNGVAA